MNKFLLLFFFSFLAFSDVVKAKIPHVIYAKEDFEGKLDSLRTLYGNNKTMPEKFELQILLALSHYPELKDTRITFQLKESFIPLISRPRIISMFGPKKNWHYKIMISDASEFGYAEVLLKNIPFNGQVGIIGHELAHTVYYLDKSLSDMLGTGLNYIFFGYRSDFEKDTDRRAIHHGLGWQLLDYSIYIRKLPDMDEDHIAWIDKFYMNEAEVRAYMNECSGMYDFSCE